MVGEGWKGKNLVSKIFFFMMLLIMVLFYPIMLYMATTPYNRLKMEIITQEEYDKIITDFIVFSIWFALILVIIGICTGVSYLFYKIKIMDEYSGERQTKGWASHRSGVIEKFDWDIDMVIPWSDVPEELRELVLKREEELFLINETETKEEGALDET